MGCVNSILDNSTVFMTTCKVTLGQRFSPNSRPAVEAECYVDLDKMMFEWTDMHDGALPVSLCFTKIVQLLEEEFEPMQLLEDEFTPRPPGRHATAFPRQSREITEL